MLRRRPLELLARRPLRQREQHRQRPPDRVPRRRRARRIGPRHHHLAKAPLLARHPRLDDGGLAHARLTDEHQRLAVEPLEPPEHLVAPDQRQRQPRHPRLRRPGHRRLHRRERARRTQDRAALGAKARRARQRRPALLAALARHAAHRRFHRLLHLRGRAEAVLAVLVERAQAHRLEGARNRQIRPALRRRLRRMVQMRHEHVDERPVAGKRSRPGHGLVEHDAGGVDVGARVELLAADLLRAHVIGRAADGAARGQVRVALAAQLGDAEVEHLDVLFAGAQRLDEDVLRLEVAVHDAGGVRLIERRQRLAEQVHQARRRQRRLVADDLRQVAPAQQLHHQEQRARVRLAEVEHLDRVRMAQPRRRPRLRLKSPEGLDVGRHLGVQELDRHGSVEREVVRAIHPSHRADADELGDVVLRGQRRAHVGIAGLDEGGRHVGATRRAVPVAVPAGSRTGGTSFHVQIVH